MSDGDKALVALLVVAGAYDAWALANDRETISAAVHKHRRWLRPVRFYLALHFERVIPNRYDPLRRWLR
jgi:hypothetical protein